MEAVDKKLRELLSKKFEGAEMDVDPSIWDGINSSMSTGVSGGSGLAGSSSGLTGSAGFWLAASIVAVSVLTYVVWPETDIPEQQQTAQVDTLPREETVKPEVEEIIEPVEATDQPEVGANGDVIVSVPSSSSNSNPISSSSVDNTEQDEIPVENGTTVQSEEPLGTDEAPEPPIAQPQKTEESEPGLAGDQAIEDDRIPATKETTKETIEEETSDPATKVEGIVRPLANVFSPNGDGKNDFILPELNEPEIVSIQVIQMTTGQIVFRAQELKAWYGRDMNGQDLPPGSYLYIVEMTDSIGNSDQESGIVRLFR
jgi:hypothetical protein